MGRVWADGAGNYMGSVAVPLLPGDPPPATLALVAGLAAHQAIGAVAAVPVQLKWPNDLMIGAAKLGGILLERSGDWVVVGIGINIRAAPDVPDRATRALVDVDPAASADGTRDRLAAALAAAFRAALNDWRAQPLSALLARWQTAAHPPGTPLRVRLADGAVEAGAFAGLAADGALLLTAADGRMVTVHAGDVAVVGEILGADDVAGN